MNNMDINLDNKTIIGVLAVFLFLLGFSLWFFPVYSVWKQGLKGEGILARAEQERRVLVEQAQAELDSASLRAEAIQIVGEAAQKYPEYRMQEFIGAFGEALQNGNIQKIIYVPTEANIPIIEAGRLLGR